MRLVPPLRQQRDRDAIRAGLADGTIDALVSDHTPVTEDEKHLPFAEASPGATGLELLLGLALSGARQPASAWRRRSRAVTSRPCAVLARSSRSAADARRAAWPSARRPTSASSTRRRRGSSTRRGCSAAAGTRPSTATSCSGGCAGRWSPAGSRTTRAPSRLALAARASAWRCAAFALPRACRGVVHGLHGLAIVLFRFPRLTREERLARIRWWSQDAARPRHRLAASRARWRAAAACWRSTTSPGSTSWSCTRSCPRRASSPRPM